MIKTNQSLLDFLQNAPLATFLVQRSMISNKEAQTLYDIWTRTETDEYGKHLLGTDADVMQIASLTTKGYVRNIPTRLGSPSILEFTNKGKDIIKKIILHQEKSSFEKESQIDYAAICRSSTIEEMKSKGKVASRKYIQPRNWLERAIVASCVHVEL